MIKKALKLSALLMCVVFGFGGCAGGSSEETTHSKVKFEMEDGTTFVVELYPEYAPETVANFLKLVNEGFYNGLTFHRVIPGFMVQGGCPEGTGMGGSGKNIPGEFAANGYEKNTLSHKKGVISMARAQAPNSASSQFFICVDDASFLDGNYAAFGEVIEGMENVDPIALVKTDPNDKPLTPVVMKNVSVVTE